jgi:hypothetical protein
MRHFDKIIEKAMLNLREENSNPSSLPDPHSMISAFQSLNSQQQQSILKLLPQQGIKLNDDDQNHKDVSSWIELMHANAANPKTTVTTTPSQAQAQTPDSTGANPTGVNTNSPGAGNNPTIV